MLSRTWVRVVLLVAFVALVAYSVFAAPPRDVALERTMWTFQFEGVDATLIALFLIMGLNSDLFVVLLLRDGRFRRVPGWPFALSSFVLGSFIMLPYLALRGPERPPRPMGRVTRIASSRPLLWVIATCFVAVIAFAIIRGDASAFVHAFRTTWFINVMAIDCVIEWLLLSLLLVDDVHHR